MKNTDSLPRNNYRQGIALITMPMASISWPSISIGLLKSILKKRSIPCDDYYFNLDFAKLVGYKDIQALNRLDSNKIGEYLFIGELYESEPRENEYFDLVKKKKADEMSLDELEEIFWSAQQIRHKQVPLFLDKLITSFNWQKYEMIGFTSSLYQHAATLALSKRLKTHFPEVPIIIGGANVHCEMGPAWLECTPYIDYVCFGEGDTVFPELIENLRKGKKIDKISNIAYRHAGKIIQGPEPIATVNLNDLPYPDYSSYYTRIREIGMEQELRSVIPAVPIETSRGCWWGEKKKCTFCGLNSMSIAYRSKSPRRVYKELKSLSRKYLATSFQLVDNVIDLKHLDELFNWLNRDRSDLGFFMEVRPNLTISQLRKLKSAGVYSIQPGIESLNTDVLRLMNKGATGIRNVFLLKWAKYLGIKVLWNLLYGVPGENQTNYLQQIEWMRLIHHLDPPNGPVRIVLERFSPLHSNPERHNLYRVRPEGLYNILYSDLGVNVNQSCYSFDYETNSILPHSSIENLKAAVQSWRKAYTQGSLLYYCRSPSGFIVVNDYRKENSIRRFYYSSPVAELYEIAGLHVATAERLKHEISLRYSHDLPLNFIKDALQRFVKRGLAIQEGERYLTLALPQNDSFRSSDG